MDLRTLMNEALSLIDLEKETHDSGIILEGENIKRVIMGVDMEAPELLIAKQLGFDAVVSHHPLTGSPDVNFAKVMDIQIDRMMHFGIPVNRAQKALRPKQNAVERASHAGNYDRVASAAKLLEMPYMNIHLPADLIGEAKIQAYMEDRFNHKPKAKLKDVIDALNELDVYKDALAKPAIRVGGENDYAGKIAVLFAGGTNGGSDVYKAYFEHGVGTIIAMHCPEDVIKAVNEQNYGNVIVAGHMPSDSIGLRVIADHWRSLGIEVVTTAGIL